MKRRSILLSMISLLAATALLLGGCTQQSGETDADTTSDSSAATSEITEKDTVNGDIAIFKDGKCLYESVIYSADASEKQAAAASAVFTCLRELTSKIAFEDDKYYRADRKEIVVALASEYPEVEPLTEGLRYNDYVIAVSGNKLVVTALSEEGLDAAATKLVKMITSAAGREVTDLYVDAVSYKAKYKLSSFTVSGNDIKDYTLIYPKVSSASDVNYLPAALSWQSMIGSACGYLLPVSDDSAAVGDKEILIGNTNREQSTAEIKPLHYSVSVSGTKLVVASGGSYSSERISAQFRKEYIDLATSLALDTSLSFTGDLLNEDEYARAEGTTVRIMSANILAEFPNWNNSLKECPVDPRLEIFLANLYAYRPDLVTATEVSENWAALLKANLKEGYKIILDKREGGAANYSLLIYNDSTLELKDSGIDAYTVNDNPKCRNMGWGVFKIRTSEKEFAAISTHFNLGANRSSVQVDEFNAKVVELSANGTRPVLSGGDFNIYMEWEEYSHLMSLGKVNNLKDVTANLRNNIGTVKGGVGFAANENSAIIDYIFGTKDVECLMFMTVVDNFTIDMSDHNSLIADVKF